jgi:hypothetical protein
VEVVIGLGGNLQFWIIDDKIVILTSITGKE